MSNLSSILSIEKIVAGGLGLARDKQGVVLVEGALPGEKVRAVIGKAGKGVRRAKVSEIIDSSPDRLNNTPQLPTTNLAHARYAAQLVYKRSFIVEALSRIAKLPTSAAEAITGQTVASPQEWHYRNIIQYLITPQGFAYRQRLAHQPKVIASDPLVMPAIWQLLDSLDQHQLGPAQEIAIRASQLTGEVVVALIGQGEPRQFLRASDALLDAGAIGVSIARPAGKRFSAGVKLIAGESEIWEKFGQVHSLINATGFAQVNPNAAGLAYQKAAQLSGNGGHLVDLYGGSGAIGRHAAGQFERVTVIDTAAEALARGRQDANEAQALNAANGRHGAKIRFRRGDASLLSQIGAEAIIVDPPRSGLDNSARQHIANSTAERLVYVSCDPATWARDVGQLLGKGWQLREVQPHDFYPQTSHIELISLLER